MIVRKADSPQAPLAVDSGSTSLRLRIALLTPYTGGNLGDAAIQEGVIDNIRRRHPDAVLCMITLCPASTSLRHGLASHPLNSTTPGSLGIGRGLGRLRDRCMQLLNEARHWMLAWKIISAQDLLLISGGGQIDDHWGGPWGHPYALFKWTLLARLRHVRCAWMSIGTSHIASALSRFFLSRSLARADYRSYRDEPSRASAQRLWSGAATDVVLPDLVFSHKHAAEPRLATTPCVIAVSPINRLSCKKKDWLAHADYLSNLVRFIRELRRTGSKVVLFSSASLDRSLVLEIAALAREPDEGAGAIEAFCPDTPWELLDWLKNADYVVTSRLHGILLSHIALRPVLAVSYDLKVDTYMKANGFGTYQLDLASCRLPALLHGFGLLRQECEVIARKLQLQRSRFAGELAAQYDRVLVPGSAARGPGDGA